MNRQTITALGCAFALLVIVAFGGGCRSGSPKPAPRTDPAAALGEGQRKDVAIETEARAIAANSTDSAFVSGAASRILDVLRLSPWSKTEATIKALVGERDAAFRGNDDLRRQLDAANQKTDQLIRLGAAGFGLLLIAAGVAVAVIAAKAGGVFFGLGPWQAGAISAAGAVLLFVSFAYGWALRNQGWVMGAFGAALLAAAVLWFANRKHHLAAA